MDMFHNIIDFNQTSVIGSSTRQAIQDYVFSTAAYGVFTVITLLFQLLYYVWPGLATKRIFGFIYSVLHIVSFILLIVIFVTLPAISNPTWYVVTFLMITVIVVITVIYGNKYRMSLLMLAKYGFHHAWYGPNCIKFMHQTGTTMVPFHKPVPVLLTYMYEGKVFCSGIDTPIPKLLGPPTRAVQFTLDSALSFADMKINLEFGVLKDTKARILAADFLDDAGLKQVLTAPRNRAKLFTS